MRTPMFSVIVPVYNVEEYLDKCIQSVIWQKFIDWELILVDDGSEDGSGLICDRYAAEDCRIKVIHQENGGASKARNTGLDNSKGEYVLFLDSDDFYNDLNALEILFNAVCEENSDIILFGCTDFNMNTGEEIISRTGYDLELIGEKDYQKTMHYLFSNKLIPGGPTIFAFKSSVAKNNGIRFKQDIQNEDYDFVLSVFTCCNSIAAINNPFYSYRKGRANSVTGSSSIKMIFGIDYTVTKWLKKCESINDEILRKDIKNYLSFIYSTGFVICGRMNVETRQMALKIMEKHEKVLSYSYWKKPTIAKYAIMVVGMNAFSVMASKFFDRTHIF